MRQASALGDAAVHVVARAALCALCEDHHLGPCVIVSSASNIDGVAPNARPSFYQGFGRIQLDQVTAAVASFRRPTSNQTPSAHIRSRRLWGDFNSYKVHRSLA